MRVSDIRNEAGVQVIKKRKKKAPGRALKEFTLTKQENLLSAPDSLLQMSGVAVTHDLYVLKRRFDGAEVFGG